MAKTYEEINDKIRAGKAVVMTAEEVAELARTTPAKEIARKVDVVTTATFGAMCSSGAFLNFGHPTPGIRMETIELNGVRVSGGLAAVLYSGSVIGSVAVSCAAVFLITGPSSASTPGGVIHAETGIVRCSMRLRESQYKSTGR